MPKEITIGQLIDDNWIIWREGEKMTNQKRKFYQVNEFKQSFKKWNSVILEKSEKSGRFVHRIGCCASHNFKEKSICAFTWASEPFCETKMRAEPRIKFICSEKEKKDPMFEWMERDRLAPK